MLSSLLTFTVFAVYKKRKNCCCQIRKIRFFALQPSHKKSPRHDRRMLNLIYFLSLTACFLPRWRCLRAIGRSISQKLTFPFGVFDKGCRGKGEKRTSNFTARKLIHIKSMSSTKFTKVKKRFKVNCFQALGWFPVSWWFEGDETILFITCWTHFPVQIICG